MILREIMSRAVVDFLVQKVLYSAFVKVCGKLLYKACYNNHITSGLSKFCLIDDADKGVR